MFFRLSDGSTLLYTGHYNIEPADLVKGKFAPRSNFELQNNFRFIPTSGNRVLVAGKVAKSDVRWTDESNKGTYVYFGKIQPKESKTALSLVDPSVPQWITDRIEAFLPKLFAFYGKKLARSLGYRPTVFVTYSKPDHPGIGNKGGTLPGVIQLDMVGKDFRKESRLGELWLLQFLAHEAAHMWNGQMYNSDDRDWMSEGGADAFAFRAMRHLGSINDKELRAKYQKAADDCAKGLKGMSLEESVDKGEWHNYYFCGSSIGLVTESQWSGDLFSFWRQLLDKADMNQKVYTDELYYQLLGSTKQGKLLAKSIADFMEIKHKDPARALEALFQRAGVDCKLIKAGKFLCN